MSSSAFFAILRFIMVFSHCTGSASLVLICKASSKAVMAWRISSLPTSPPVRVAWSHSTNPKLFWVMAHCWGKLLLRPDR